MRLECKSFLDDFSSSARAKTEIVLTSKTNFCSPYLYTLVLVISSIVDVNILGINNDRNDIRKVHQKLKYEQYYYAIEIECDSSHSMQVKLGKRPMLTFSLITR